MNRILAALAAASLSATALTAATAAPAAAGGCVGTICGTIKHYTPDDGLDVPILIRCNYGDPSTNHKLYEGETSSKYCKDTDQVKVQDGQEIWCKYYWTDAGPETGWHWFKAKPSPDDNNPGTWMDATGWYKIDNAWDDGAGCTVRAD